jgi:hypothetical protein
MAQREWYLVKDCLLVRILDLNSIDNSMMEENSYYSIYAHSRQECTRRIMERKDWHIFQRTN